MQNYKYRFLVSGLIVVVIALVFLIWRNQRVENSDGIASNPQVKVDSKTPAKQTRLLQLLEQNQKSKRIETIKEKEESEKRRLAAWKANFPYKPTYRTDFKFDPERYDPNDPSTFSNDPEMQEAVMDHGFMTLFFKNPQIYSAEFEQLYHLLSEIDRAENPKITGLIFTQLQEYHKIMAKYNLDDLWAKNDLVPPDDGQGPLVEKMIPIDGKTTWGEKAYEHIASIVGLLAMSKHWPDKPLMDADEARAFRDRLVKEIPSKNFVNMPLVVYLPNGDTGGFAYDHDVEKNLKAGEPLLAVRN